ncbi:MAG: hypothetical protein LC776_02765 [Acidobacteria bacterium]|nr:hypothetical protein [Acidobacteriota bacterium]
MRNIVLPVLSAALLSLAGCGGQGDDSLGDDAADAAEAEAENIEAMADNASGEQADRLEGLADEVEDRGEAAEKRIDESDVDAGELTDAQKNALVNGQ